MVTYILCVWLPLKMCQPMPMDRCYADLDYYTRQGIKATCEPQKPGGYVAPR